MISYEEWCNETFDIYLLLKKLQSSFPEQCIGFYLSKYCNFHIEYAKTFSWLERQSLDIYIPKYNLGIEYDGGYYHAKKVESDQRKSALCFENKVQLIRIREERKKKTQFENDFVISYWPDSSYKNINEPLQKLFEILIDYTGEKINYNIDANRDRDKISIYIHEKYFEKSMAYNWPEIFDYWDNDTITPFYLFCSDNAPLKCPHCGRQVSYKPRYHSHRKSLVPCACEYASIEKMLNEVKQNYKEHNILPVLDSSFQSRRLYDRIISDIRFGCYDPIELTLYEKMGFDIGGKKLLIKE